ncbi:MAG: hypothetical protein AAF533_13740 [Acidobacteriota bacterium]
MTDELESQVAYSALIGSYFGCLASLYWLYEEGSQGALALGIASATTLMLAAAKLLVRNKTPGRETGSLDENNIQKLVKGAMETACRGVSAPDLPESTKLSAFIFKLEQGWLNCTHYWTANPRVEQVGQLRFKMDPNLMEDVAVVSAALRKEPCRTSVQPLARRDGIEGQTNPKLNFVLAVPIWNEDKTLWGVVDLDAANDAGRKLLEDEVSDFVMFSLAKHLHELLTLPRQ